MRSRKIHTITRPEVHRWTLHWLIDSMGLKDHGWKCTAVLVWNLVLRAAAGAMSLAAACRDLDGAPSDQALFNALRAGLPKTLGVLEARLDRALTGFLPRRLCRRAWTVAIDWHLLPYYGQPQRSRNELFYGKPRQGTKQFHAYATACIVVEGVRYTLAATWVRRHESTVVALGRLLARIAAQGLKIRRLLLDRAFFNARVAHFLEQHEMPFLMPVMFRGRRPKRGKKLSGLRWIKRQKAGWYGHVLKNRQQEVPVRIAVAYRSHKNRRDRKRKWQKLLFAAWRVSGSPQEIRALYRKRFGIETSYRQWRQARIFTSTRDPHLRLLFVVIGLLLRNVWVWLHDTRLSEGAGARRTLQLEKLRFRRMLEWIAWQVVAQLQDRTLASVDDTHRGQNWNY